MSERHHTARDRTALNGRRFLVVDDQGYMIDVINEILKHFGAGDTARAESVEAAIRRIGPQQAYDAIVCDFNMKPTNGIQFLQAIRAGRHRDIKRDQRFILLTGHGEMDVVRAAKSLDVNGYVVKPVAPDLFIKTVERALGAAPAVKPAGDYERIPIGDLHRFQ
ncbi:MAG: response regulator [Rhodospirillaceae bacterium]|nr:response regulator [Rhodospirillaceae bacterium]